MTRISHAEHYRRYRLLHTLDEQGSPTVALLPTGEQWVLHDYYRFTAELTPERLARHIREVSTAQPSLPNRAGKAFRQIILKYAVLQHYVDDQAELPRAKKNTPRQLTVFSQVQPELDPGRMARILLAMPQIAEQKLYPRDD